MFGRRRKARSGSAGKPSEPMLGMDDREEILATKSADELARAMLEAAQQKASMVAVGEEVMIELTEPHRHIHRTELMLSLMTLASEYGLQAISQFDNKHYFTKL